jgi:methylated-DNA-[protein]-cysteine S-methyltransferase
MSEEEFDSDSDSDDFEPDVARADEPTTDAVEVIGSPLGDLIASSHGGLLTGVAWRYEKVAESVGSATVLDDLADQFAAYWTGDFEDFDLPIDWSLVSSFAADVLKATMAVPYGRTSTYGAIADVIGRPGEARAVGGALRDNPWVIVVPCHRIISADGSLTGYGGGLTTGGHLDIKQLLLDHESQRFAPRLF